MNVLELKGVMTKDQLVEKVKKYEDAAPVEVELGDKVGFRIDKEGKAKFEHDKGVTDLSPDTFAKLLSNVGLPRPYLAKIPVEQRNKLITPHLNWWYQEQLAGQVLRLLTVKNNAIDVIPKANFKHVKVSEVLDAIDAVMGKSVAGFHKAWIGPVSFNFSVLTPREVEVVDGHTYNSGIRIEHSMTGQVSTRVAPYLFNQWCTNGATTEHQLPAWKRRNNNEDIGIWLQRTITEASKLFDKEVESLQSLAGIKVTNETSATLDSVLEQSMVPRRLQKEVRNTLIDDGAKNLYDIYNILTKVDTHSNIFDEHPNSKGILDKVAAHLTHHSKLCPVCHKQVN
jgi:hypothetical protein